MLGEDLDVPLEGDAEVEKDGGVRRGLDLRLQGQGDHPVEDEDRRQHEERHQPVKADGLEELLRACVAYHPTLRTFIRIRQIPMMIANSATAMDEA
jgi:hypothetical protein